MKKKLTDVTHLQKFLLGGKAEFTIINNNSKNRYTYKFLRSESDTGVYFIRIVYEDRKNYYLGFFRVMFRPVMTVQTARISQTIEDCDRQAFEIISLLLIILYGQNRMPIGVEIQYNGRCSVCNRVLTNPKYVEIGIGPECLSKLQ
jgi:hypothetical protein